ncbi:flagellar protein FlaG [Paenibacillus qinlingensis]|uniref:Flagellar protein FlaG n=1 Tax=Paenibacillus qinlingensis TaxID=1837343 RepID=A0ABU1P1F4_9BACL|nr:flagellar protein FlaG [Paenibacillus qinlingensis]MDR6553576.1 flagellar protein FlaG [Paenibacillus qinlingensis]
MENISKVAIGTFPQQSYDRPKLEIQGSATSSKSDLPEQVDYISKQADDNLKKEYLEQELDKSIDVLNKLMQLNYTHVSFQKHEKTNEYYIQVINDETQEVIREIPSKKVLDRVAEMNKMVGLLIDQKR